MNDIQHRDNEYSFAVTASYESVFMTVLTDGKSYIRYFIGCNRSIVKPFIHKSFNCETLSCNRFNRLFYQF